MHLALNWSFKIDFIVEFIPSVAFMMVKQALDPNGPYKEADWSQFYILGPSSDSNRSTSSYWQYSSVL